MSAIFTSPYPVAAEARVVVVVVENHRVAVVVEKTGFQPCLFATRQIVPKPSALLAEL